uniref:diphosphomevalonate decarboxylase n=1 Tax=Streptomyces sp. NBC_00180 TaxID=2903632 RepID=A0AAU1IA12_9ACTN
MWATANANLALVKYWGKSGLPGNQAANASLSVTLEGLISLAAVRERRDADIDRAAWSPPGPVEDLTRFVGQARTALGIRHPLDVAVTSNFPVGAGLASSASAYAALATALAAAAGRPDADLSALVRSGSGSACRSLLAGFVEWQPGAGKGDVTQVAPPAHWPLCVIVAVTREQPKRISSREGMRRTAVTSPFYDAWLAANPEDMRAAREAVRHRNLDSLGPVMEHNAMRMHATALGADPPLLYWEPATLAVVHAVWRLRESGTPAYFSIDAGPQVKVLCEPAHADEVAERLGEVPGVSRLIRSRPGQAPRVVTHPPSWAQLPPTWRDWQ